MITKEFVIAGAAVQAIRIVTLSHLLNHLRHMVQLHDYILLSARLCLFSCILIIISKLLKYNFVQA